MGHVLDFILLPFIMKTHCSFFSERELKCMFAICHRRSVCLSSVVCLLSVCNVGAPYSGD